MDAQTREDSKIMARFMGYEYYPRIPDGQPKPPNYKVGWRLKVPNTKINSHKWYLCRSHNDLPFIHDWNLLIDCCRKLKSLDADLEDLKYESLCKYALNSLSRKIFFNQLVGWIKYKNSLE